MLEERGDGYRMEMEGVSQHFRLHDILHEHIHDLSHMAAETPTDGKAIARPISTQSNRGSKQISGMGIHTAMIGPLR